MKKILTIAILIVLLAGISIPAGIFAQNSQAPEGDNEVPWDARPRPEINEWIRKFLEYLREKYGINVDDALRVLPEIEFHETGKDTEVAIGPDSSGVTIYPGGIGLRWYNGQLIIVFDGHIHTVISPETVAEILNGNDDFPDLSQPYLKQQVATIIHELMHAMLHSSGCGADTEELAGALENLIDAFISYTERYREAYAAHNGDVQKVNNERIVKMRKDTVNYWIDMVIQNGGADCLTRLGISRIP